MDWSIAGMHWPVRAPYNCRQCQFKTNFLAPAHRKCTAKDGPSDCNCPTERMTWDQKQLTCGGLLLLNGAWLVCAALT
jgi:hypothetical protein